MTELKTLKDLTLWDKVELIENTEGHAHIEELKAEAVK